MSDRVNDGKGGAPISIYSRFVELLLIVGLDENTGLVPVNQDHGNVRFSFFVL